MEWLGILLLGGLAGMLADLLRHLARRREQQPQPDPEVSRHILEAERKRDAVAHEQRLERARTNGHSVVVEYETETGELGNFRLDPDDLQSIDRFLDLTRAKQPRGGHERAVGVT